MNCCNNKKEQRKGFLRGLFYGIVPHTFCIVFIVFTILGTTAATAFLKPLLLNPYFFYILIALSFVFATISAAIYLKRNGVLSLNGTKRKWRYLTALYGVTISVNLLLFMVIFPAVANIDFKSSALTADVSQTPMNYVTLRVAIPCSGHAPLIITELKKIDGVGNVKFRFPNLFDVAYNPMKTSEDRLISLEIFKEYQAIILK